MRYITDAVQMKEIDRRTSEEAGIPPVVLMEKAAEQIARIALGMLRAAGKQKGRVLAVYGAGGNGGDAVAAARLLYFRGISVTLLPADKKVPCELTQTELAIARKCGIPEWTGTCTDVDFSAYDIILDGIFGIGLSRPAAGEYGALIGRINASKVKVLAIDIPSGIYAGTGECPGTAVQADVTVTFGEYKIGHFLYPGALFCGKLVLADAGFVPEFCRQILVGGSYRYFTYEKRDAAALLPVRVPHSNKGSYGKVLVYAGSAEVTGAAYLAAKAAYRCGVGLVKLVSAGKCLDVVRRMLPEALYEEIPEQGQGAFWEAQVQWADAVLAGPGIGTGQDAVRALTGLLDAVKAGSTEKTEAKPFPDSGTERDGRAVGAGTKPLILDADALNILAGFCGTKRAGGGTFAERVSVLAARLPQGTVLTPHPKELSRLTGLSVNEITKHLVDTAKQCIYNNKLIYVLKDAHTIVAGGRELYINRSGCDGMATGGSGDVLAGIIAGLSVGRQPFEAATAGVFLHGLAGERAQGRCGCRAMLAGDILDGMLLTEKEERRRSTGDARARIW